MERAKKSDVSQDYYKPFPTALRKLLDENSVSQSELAKAIEVKRQTVNSYTLGTTIPDIEKFKNIADYFDVSYDYLLGKSENEKRENIDIGKAVGLSDKAITALQEYQHHLELARLEKEECRNVVNILFESREFFAFLRDLRDYLFVGFSWTQTKISETGNSEWDSRSGPGVPDADGNIRHFDPEQLSLVYLTAIQKDLLELKKEVVEHGDGSETR